MGLIGLTHWGAKCMDICCQVMLQKQDMVWEEQRRRGRAWRGCSGERAHLLLQDKRCWKCRRRAS